MTLKPCSHSSVSTSQTSGKCQAEQLVRREKGGDGRMEERGVHLSLCPGRNTQNVLRQQTQDTHTHMGEVLFQSKITVYHYGKSNSPRCNHSIQGGFTVKSQCCSFLGNPEAQTSRGKRHGYFLTAC